MRFGLRLQLLALLSGLMALTFVPLWLIISAYTEFGLRQEQTQSALRLGRQIAEHLADVASDSSNGDLLALVRTEVESGAVVALIQTDPQGLPRARASRPEFLSWLAHPEPWLRRHEGSFELPGPDENRRYLGTLLKSPAGSTLAVLEVERSPAKARPLQQLLSLYLAVTAAFVLLLCYVALTRFIIRPVLELETAAERVAAGGRRLEPLKNAPEELARLSASLGQMTDRLRDEEAKLRDKVSELEQARAQLETAQASLLRSERLATVGRLSAGLAHEIGNPLSAIMGLLELLLEGGLSPEEERDFLRRARGETERVHHILSDLLAFARRRPPSQLSTPGEVRAALAAVERLLQPQKEFAELQLLLELPPDLPRVGLSEAELTQVVLNLVMNAKDACQGRGTISLCARLRRSEAEGDRVELRIQDDGPGIPEELREAVFEPFFSTKEPGKGSGLGLSVSRGLLEAVGGQLLLEPTPPPGCCFVLLLPRAASAD